MGSPLEKQAEFVVGFTLDAVGEDVRQAAKLCILDTVGVAVGAGDDKQVRRAVDAFRAMEKGCEEIPAWGSDVRLSVFRSAFVNALMGHTLELDDVHVRSKTHIGTVVIPAAWAMAEKLGRDGGQFLESVICGYEVMARIGMGFGVSSHRQKGWHATSTAGTFGAAAACAKLLNLSVEQTANALGLAGAQSFGLWAFLEAGATSKPLHPARAAMTGMESAVLARSGMTGPVGILDARDGGLFPAMSDGYDLSLVTDGLGERYEILQLDKKPYPCCRSTHCAIDAALRLRREHGIVADDIESILVKTYKVGYMQVGCSAPSLDPRLPSDAKFSTPYVVACAMLDGRVGLGQFLPETMARADIRALLRRVAVTEDETFTNRYPKNWGCLMTVKTKSGKEYSLEVPDASGSVGAPMSAEAVKDKAVSTARPVLGERAEAVLSKLLTVESLPALDGFFDR